MRRIGVRRASGGFTLVELMVGVMASAILALTVGAMLFVTYRGWQSIQSVAAMERDGSLAMDTMRRAIRGSSSSRWVSASCRLDVYTNAAVAWQFASNNTRLVYTAGGRGMDLVSTGLTAFSCASVSGRVTVVVNLRDPSSGGIGATMNMSNTISSRNYAGL
jgi:prepilin-type N-terminal cleavage/methylation domain-containing protein